MLVAPVASRTIEFGSETVDDAAGNEKVFSGSASQSQSHHGLCHLTDGLLPLVWNL